MAHIIGIIQVKGGAGRSTIATNLAGLLSVDGKVALIDCDMPQGTAASWASIRLANNPGCMTLATAKDHKELVEQVLALSDSHDYIVLDAPPRIAEMTKAALILSNLCLIPLAASALEIWATSDLLPTINEAKAIQAGVDARIVWTRFRGSTKSGKELSAVARSELGLNELATKLGYRVAYSEALARGMTVTEWHERTARTEVQALGKEVKRILGAKK